MSFPSSKNKYAFLIAGTQNLECSVRDISSLLAILCGRLGFLPENVYIFSDGGIPLKLHPHINVERDIHKLDTIFTKMNLAVGSESKEEADIFLAISAHGYQGYNQSSTQVDKLDEYFFFGGTKIVDDMMSAKLAKLHHKIKLLALIDTCHSETMLDLHHIKHPGLVSISACGDTQSSMQDISQDFGYGGGLVCAFADYLHENKIKDSFNIEDLYKSVYKRLLLFRQHSFLTRSTN